MKYESVIGLEVHAQLLTESKIYSASKAAYGGDPNSKTDPVVLGLPGVLPRVNKRAIEFAIMMGLATNCEIASFSRFARKHYFYPDSPKGYQLSQFEHPVCENGYVEIELEDGATRKIGLIRIHLEEDAGKSIHDPALAGDATLVDLNRCGVPLIEIVSQPDMRTPRDASIYLKELKRIVTYLGICDAIMEEGSFRCDANISLRPFGAKELGVKTELKNMNSFRNVERALTFEIKRQSSLLDAGGHVVQETLLWDADANTARTMRSKEEAEDYRYLPEPDIPPLQISREWIQIVAEQLPELPSNRMRRFISEFGLSQDDADLLTAERPLADFYELVAANCGNPKLAANWVMSDVLRVLNDRKIDISDFPVDADRLAGLLSLIQNGTISSSIAKTVFEQMLTVDSSAEKIVEQKGLGQISDTGVIESIVDEVVENNSEQVEQYKAGKTKILAYLVGQVMKQTRGKANPGMVNELLREKLSE